MEYGYYKRVVDINTSGLYGGLIPTAFNNAVSKWNGKNLIRSIEVKASSQNLAYSTYDTDNYHGQYEVIYVNSSSRNRTVMFELKFNTYQLPSSDYTSFFITALHELGHTFGLNDLSSGESVMNVNTWAYSEPTSLDCQNVNASWP